MARAWVPAAAVLASVAAVQALRLSLPSGEEGTPLEVAMQAALALPVAAGAATCVLRWRRSGSAGWLAAALAFLLAVPSLLAAWEDTDRKVNAAGEDWSCSTKGFVPEAVTRPLQPLVFGTPLASAAVALAGLALAWPWGRRPWAPWLALAGLAAVSAWLGAVSMCSP